MYSTMLPLLLLAAIPGGLAAQCNADNCARAVTGTINHLQSTHLADCSAFMACAVTPAPSTVTSTVTVTPAMSFVTVTSTKLGKRCVKRAPSSSSAATSALTTSTAVTNCQAQVPTYASACSGSSRYSSACSCAGVTNHMTTVPASTITTTTTTTLPVGVSTQVVQCSVATSTTTITTTLGTSPPAVTGLTTLTYTGTLVTVTTTITDVIPATFTHAGVVTAPGSTVTVTAQGGTVSCFSTPGLQLAAAVAAKEKRGSAIVPTTSATSPISAAANNICATQVVTQTVTATAVQNPLTSIITTSVTVTPTTTITNTQVFTSTELDSIIYTVPGPLRTVTVTAAPTVSPTGISYYFYDNQPEGTNYANLQNVVNGLRDNPGYVVTDSVQNLNSFQTDGNGNIFLPNEGYAYGANTAMIFQGYLWPALGAGTYTITSRAARLDDAGAVWLGQNALGTNWNFNNANYVSVCCSSQYPAGQSTSVQLAADYAMPLTIFWGNSNNPGRADFVITYNGVEYDDTTQFLVGDCGYNNFTP